MNVRNARWLAGLTALTLALSACGGSAAPPSVAPANTNVSAAAQAGGAPASAKASTAAQASGSPASAKASTAAQASGSPASANAAAKASSAPASTSGSGVAKASTAAAASQPGFVNGNPYLAKPGQAPETIKAAWCAVSAGFVQLYVARDYHLFDKYGLNVQTSGIVNAGSSGALAALESGQIDILYCAAASTIPGMASGVDATLVAAPLVGLPYVMVGHKDISSIQGLKGKKIGISRQGDLDDRLSHLVVQKAGLQPNQVQFVPAGGQAARYKSLLGGIVDAVNVTPPFDVQAKNDGLHVIYELKNLNIPFIYSAVHTNSKMLKQHPEAVQKFVAAMAESVWYIQNHKAETEQSISKQLKITDKAALDSAYQAYAETFVNRSVDVPLPAVQDSIDFAKTQGTKIKKGQASELVDPKFSQNLQTSGFLEKMWGHAIPGSK